MKPSATIRKHWTSSEDALVREFYPHRPTIELAEKLGRRIGSVYQRAAALGLSKSEEYRASPMAYRFRRGAHAGWAHRYPKGHVPANKGLRRPGWAPGRMAATQFKKGERKGAAQHNWKPIGTVCPDTDGYLRRKIAEGAGGFGNQKAWEFVHRRVWEDENGPIPSGHAVCFRDGNKENTALENLEAVSRAELMKRNSVHNLPKELALAIQLTGALKRKLRTKERKLNGEEHATGSAGPSVCHA